MEKLTKEKKIRVIKEKQIKPKRIKKINVQNNNVVIKYYCLFSKKNIINDI